MGASLAMPGVLEEDSREVAHAVSHAAHAAAHAAHSAKHAVEHALDTKQLEKAAVRIEAIWRGHQVRRSSRPVAFLQHEEEEEEERKAATMIQARAERSSGARPID